MWSGVAHFASCCSYMYMGTAHRHVILIDLHLSDKYNQPIIKLCRKKIVNFECTHDSLYTPPSPVHCQYLLYSVGHSALATEEGFQTNVIFHTATYNTLYTSMNHPKIVYSKTYVKRPLKNSRNKDLNEKWLLNEGRKYCRMLPLEHSAILLPCI